MELPNDINSLRKNQMIRICKALSSDMKFLIRDCFDFMGEKPHSSWRVGFLMWLSEAINSYETTIYRKDGSCAIYHLNQMNISKLAYILFMVPDGKWTISEGPQDVIEWIKSLSGTF